MHFASRHLRNRHLQLAGLSLGPSTIPSAQRDQVNRTAPIVCCGRYKSPFDDALPGTVLSGIGDFAARIGRSLAPGNMDAARDAFGYKKSSTRKRVRALAIAVVLILIPLVAYALVSRGS